MPIDLIIKPYFSPVETAASPISLPALLPQSPNHLFTLANRKVPRMITPTVPMVLSKVSVSAYCQIAIIDELIPIRIQTVIIVNANPFTSLGLINPLRFDGASADVSFLWFSIINIPFPWPMASSSSIFIAATISLFAVS